MQTELWQGEPGEKPLTPAPRVRKHKRKPPQHKPHRPDPPSRHDPKEKKTVSCGLGLTGLLDLGVAGTGKSAPKDHHVGGRVASPKSPDMLSPREAEATRLQNAPKPDLKNLRSTKDPPLPDASLEDSHAEAKPSHFGLTPARVSRDPNRQKNKENKERTRTDKGEKERTNEKQKKTPTHTQSPTQNQQKGYRKPNTILNN